MPYKWEIAEGYLRRQAAPGQSFNCAAMAADLGISTRKVTDLLQAYQAAQRGPRSRTAYVIHRTGRTSAAVWHVGARVLDARQLTRQTVDDFTARVVDAIGPDLARMGVQNPRIAAMVTASANAFVANLNALAAALP